MENTENFGKKKRLLELLKNKDFVDFISYYEDKWLQNSKIEDRLISIFGNIEKAIILFEKDEIFNRNNF